MMNTRPDRSSAAILCSEARRAIGPLLREIQLLRCRPSAKSARAIPQGCARTGKFKPVSPKLSFSGYRLQTGRLGALRRSQKCAPMRRLGAPALKIIEHVHEIYVRIIRRVVGVEILMHVAVGEVLRA